MTHRPRPFLTLAPAVLASVLGAVPAAAQPALPLYEDLPADELLLNAGVDPYPQNEFSLTSLGRPDGRMCHLALRGRTLISVTSSDGGLTFRPEVVVAGPPATSEVFRFDAVASPDGTIHVAARVADADGGIALAVVSSPDMGATWTAPHVLAGRGDPGSGFSAGYLFLARDLAMSAAGGGRAAIAWLSPADDAVWASASVDGGASWTAPRLVLTPAPTPGVRASSVDVEVSATGAIHVVASAVMPGNAVRGIFAVRSLDGGATFENPVIVFRPPGTVFGSADYPDLAVAGDGDLVVALSTRDAATYEDVVLVYRSVDAGATWARTARIVVDDDYTLVAPLLRARRGGQDVVLAYVARSTLYGHASQDAGSSFGARTALGSVASASSFTNDVVELPDGAWAALWGTSALPPTIIRISVDGGGTWGAPRSVDARTIVEVVPAEPGTIAVAFTAGSPGGDRRYLHLYVSREPLVGGDVGSGVPATEPGPVGDAPIRSDTAVTTTGGAGVIAAFSTTGPESRDVVTRASANRGVSFAAPVRAASFATSEEIPTGPIYLETAPDGAVWLAHLTAFSGPSGLARNVYVQRSTDAGASWSAPAVALTTTTALTQDSLRLVAISSDVAVLVWTNGISVFATRTVDGGATFATADVDQNVASSNREPQACRAGERIVLAWRNASGTVRNIWSATSEDGGATFGPAVAVVATLRPFDLSCSEAGTALVTWSNTLTGDGAEARVHRFDGASWRAPVAVATPGSESSTGRTVWAGFASADGASALLLASRSLPGPDFGLWAFASVDGGASFGPGVRVDVGSPFPAMPDLSPRLVFDGLEHVWIAWLEQGVGPQPSLLTARSDDAGQRFGVVRRVDGRDPQGVFLNSVSTGARFAALPEAAVFVWHGLRESNAFEPLFNSDDLRDQDRDGIPRDTDCDDLNPDGCPNAPPIADAGPDRILECSGDLRAVATLDGSASTDPDSTVEIEDIASWIWTEDGETLASGEIVEVPLGLGSHTVVLTVTDRGGLDDTDAASIVVADTAAPVGAIIAPAGGACFGPVAVPVTVVAEFSDACDPALEIRYDPGPGPSYSDHGDLVVTAAAGDEAGNAASDSVAFTIDLAPPAVAWTFPEGRSLTLPTALPLALAFTSGDDDGAAGGVVREAILLDGCTIYDGATYGDRDGLLSDEELALTAAELCRVATACGFEVLESPELRLDAADCGGNVGSATVELPGTARLRPGMCGPRSRPLGKLTKRRPASSTGTVSLERR